MSVTNILATKSLTLSDKFPLRNIKGKKILVGNKGKYSYMSYLFFNTDAIPSNISLSSATLVLFKIDKLPKVNQFAIYPLLKDFCSLTTYADCCPANPALKQGFITFACDTVVEINITPLFNKWISGHLINRGIAILEEQCNAMMSSYASFGSAYSKDKTLIPYIRVIYEKEACLPCFPIPNMSYTATVLPSRQT